MSLKCDEDNFFAEEGEMVNAEAKLFWKEPRYNDILGEWDCQFFKQQKKNV